MNATEGRELINRERTAVTARSVLANDEVLAGEGLSGQPYDRALALAETLAAPHTLTEDELSDGLTELRASVAGARGDTSRVLVTWLDDLLRRD